jgi:general secretion pathway protein G
MLPKMNSRGFTLIEILLVVIIIGILVSLVAPRLAGRSEEARKQAAHADIEGGISLALDLYEVDNGRYPARLDDLITRPSDGQNWKGPYLKKGLPKDPWGTPYSYNHPGSNNSNGYDLSSAGPDKQTGTADDIVNWKTEASF